MIRKVCAGAIGFASGAVLVGGCALVILWDLSERGRRNPFMTNRDY